MISLSPQVPQKIEHIPEGTQSEHSPDPRKNPGEKGKPSARSSRVDSRFHELLQELLLLYDSEVRYLRARTHDRSTETSAEMREEFLSDGSRAGGIYEDLRAIGVLFEPTRQISLSSAESQEEEEEEVSKIIEESCENEPADDDAPVKTASGPEVRRPRVMDNQEQQVLAFQSTAVQGQDLIEGDSFRARFGNFLMGDIYEMVITSLVVFNLLGMAIELQVAGMAAGYKLGYPRTDIAGLEMLPDAQAGLRVADLAFLAVFFLDVSTRIVILRFLFWKKWANWLDAVVVTISSVEVFSIPLSVHPGLFRILRLVKLARITRLVAHTNLLDSFILLLKCVRASIEMLFWSLSLLTAMQLVFCMVVGYLVKPFIDSVNGDMTQRQLVYEYYGTYTRTILTMFECLFGNWGPPARILTEYVSEWFTLFFLLYRCLIGFAVINVVNAVFVQQTMRVAHADEEIAFKRKLAAQQSYTRRLLQLFHALDESGDGEITWDEFSQALVSPQLKFWMSELEFEPHDLVGLFGLLDDGDERISIDEFMDGVVRLKGQARNVDVAQLLVVCRRLESKVDNCLESVTVDKSKKKRHATLRRKHLQASLELSTYGHLEPSASPQLDWTRAVSTQSA